MKASKVIGIIVIAGMLSGCSYLGDKYKVYFDTGSSKLTQVEKSIIMKAAKQAKSENRKIKLSGYADSSGSKKLNKKISEERLAVVNNELLKLGVEPMKISKTAYGEGWLEKKDQTNSEKRRVEISVY